MSRTVDLATWPRRATFEHFRGYARATFDLCVRLDVGAVVAARPRLGPHGLTLAIHHAALTAANAVEAFRLRIDGDAVRLHDRVDASLAVLRPDETIAFVHLDHRADYADFAAAAAPRFDAARRGELAFDGSGESGAMVHFTTLPWLDFTSFSHARDRGDSVPKIAFGRIVEEAAGHRMAMAVEVHHALVDGLHVARFVAAMQASLDAQRGA